MKFESVFHPPSPSGATVEADLDDLVLESIMSPITAIVEEQDDFMQGGPVALMQYV